MASEYSLSKYSLWTSQTSTEKEKSGRYLKGTHTTPVYFDKILCEESWYKMSNIFRDDGLPSLIGARLDARLRKKMGLLACPIIYL